jgi:hypothetical protein
MPGKLLQVRLPCHHCCCCCCCYSMSILTIPFPKSVVRSVRIHTGRFLGLEFNFHRKIETVCGGCPSSIHDAFVDSMILHGKKPISRQAYWTCWTAWRRSSWLYLLDLEGSVSVHVHGERSIRGILSIVIVYGKYLLPAIYRYTTYSTRCNILLQ